MNILLQLTASKIRHSEEAKGHFEASREYSRQWKRVRRLENDLGYSNFICELLPQRQKAEEKLDFLQDKNTFSGQGRKRRFCGKCSLSDILLNPRDDVKCSASNKGRGRELEEQHVPWTQPATQRAMLHGNIAQAREIPGYRLKTPAPDTLSGNFGAIDISVDRVRDRENAEATRLQRHNWRPDSRRKTEYDPQDDTPRPIGARCDKDNVSRSSSFCKSWKEQSGTIRFDTLLSEDSPHGCSLDLHPGPGPRSSEHTMIDLGGIVAIDSTTESCVLDDCALEEHKGARGGDQVASKVSKHKLIVVQAFPPRPHNRLMRTGTSRSLLSPKNPLSSNTVVAKVKQGLQSGEEKRPKVLLVGSGTFNPIHKLHIRRFFLARRYLEAERGMHVVGGIVSPSHPTLVRQRHRIRAAEIIPPKHRLSMARAAVGKGSWLVVDPWEVTRKRIMDYMSVLEHAKEVCHDTFPGHAGDITILYMCQASQIHHLNPTMIGAGGFGVITVCRPLEKRRLRKELSRSFRSNAHIVEDSAILSAELEKTSSAMVRHLLKQGKSVEGMVGKAVAHYIEENDIAQRLSGLQKWTVKDNAFMFEREDKEDRPYHTLPRVYTRRASQMPLQH